MTDSKVTIDILKQLVKKFVEDREWQQFHSPKSMSMHIATEAAELQELFLWCDNADAFNVVQKRRQAVEQEVADIAFALLNFCIRCDIDLSSAIENKMILNAQKYPIEKAKGSSAKYTEL